MNAADQTREAEKYFLAINITQISNTIVGMVNIVFILMTHATTTTTTTTKKRHEI